MGKSAGFKLVSTVPRNWCSLFQTGFQDGPVELNGGLRFRGA